ncbi:hypothetical protein [Modicisalibacter luteus]|uniref:MerR family transcriptional regulator n=1 Tax=Modicisalibacter luteus TaxID=453962 RepID=A0ABV7M4L3_9GAMM|nr:hypothetical protein [Halomonas lutea]GHA85061.1 hypothetical protein GCM10007159_02660 [Halomonas lutea]
MEREFLVVDGLKVTPETVRDWRYRMDEMKSQLEQRDGYALIALISQIRDAAGAPPSLPPDELPQFIAELRES